jgi:AcrR family transcriptional regulator
MAARRQVPETKRRIPRQARATQTASAILEAAAQILEARRLAGFTTNTVAERAGVSVGTLYQYFADKNAILLALARQEVEAALLDVDRALSGAVDPAPDGRVRAMVHAMVHAFRGRQRARKEVMQAIMERGLGHELMMPVLAFIARHGTRIGATTPQPIYAALTPLQVFILSRGMIGVIRAAVMEEQPFFKSRAFEDELVRWVTAYLQATTRDATAAPNEAVG